MLTLSLALAFVFGVSHSSGFETVIVNQAFNGREIKVRTGATIQVELEQLGAAGYTWEVQALDNEHFKVLSVKTAEPKNKGDLVGAPVLKIWQVGAIKAGNSQLTFLHCRPWEGGKSAVDKFVLNVRILGTK